MVDKKTEKKKEKKNVIAQRIVSGKSRPTGQDKLGEDNLLLNEINF